MNGPVQIDFLTADFALQRTGSQTTTSAEPGAFAEYLAAVLNPSSRNTHGTDDERFVAAARSNDAQGREESARASARQAADESPESSESGTESGREAEATALRSDATPGEDTGETTQGRDQDTDHDMPAKGDAPAGDVVDEDPESEAWEARVEGRGGNDHRLMSGLTEGRTRGADRSDPGDSAAKGVGGRSATEPESEPELEPGDRSPKVRFDERGRLIVELDAETELEYRNGADRADSDGRAIRRPTAAGAGATAGAQSAEVGGTSSRRRLRSGEGDVREDGESRDRRSVHRVEIRDLRSRASGRTDTGGASGQGRGGSSAGSSDAQASLDRSALKPQGASVDASSFHASGEEDSGSESSAHTSTSLTSPRGSGGATQVPSQSSEHTSSASSQLRQALHDHLNGDIVRAARLIIRNDDSGEIRLHLKPEHLGSVRISLHMQDGHIAGRIIVDNQTVREAFEQNLASLQRAFQESGFEASGVEVSVADSGGQQDGGGGERAGHPAPATVADRFGQVVPDLVWFDEQHELVDMVV